jgi:hypothetical protein
MNIWFAALLVILFNIPFGYWRANVKKFSLQWVLAVHIPVPFVITLRLLGNIGFQFYTYPILVTAFFLGHLFGKMIYQKIKKVHLGKVTSCLVMDVVRMKTARAN